MAAKGFEGRFLVRCVVLTEVVLVTVVAMVEDEVEEIEASAVRAAEAFERVWAKIALLPE